MRVFVVGNIVIDETFAVGRLPGEGESVFGQRLSRDLGGKGTNQAIVIARSGIETVLVAATGDDPQAALMDERIAREPVTARLVAFPNLSSDTSIVLKDEAGGNVIVTTVDCARALTAPQVRERTADAAAGDFMVLQGNLSVATTAEIIADAQRRGMQVALNPSPFEPGMEVLLPGLDILFLNEHEALQITTLAGAAAVQHLRSMGIGTVVLTRGSRGALLGTEAGLVAIAAQQCDAVDSTGAGDTLQGVAIAAALLQNGEIDARALEIAAAAAALTVSRAGTAAAFPTKSELADLFGRPSQSALPT